MEPLPPAQLCHERMVQVFNAPLLEELEHDWSLSFQPVLWCGQPVFRCVWCLFGHLPTVYIVVTPVPPVDQALLISPMSCPLRLRLIREATYEPPLMNDLVLFGTVESATPAGGPAQETATHYCSVEPSAYPVIDLTSDYVASFLRSFLFNGFKDALQDHDYC
ncbi:hypothetical protein NDU88_002100 [Pleurodeles waltl]|uniref:Uncharacterized protein n=1 Tax=Pleurodeles waltl TaxID=8319 RepID=A0AAV7UWN1_PLEWA|nr:hypothetical protein NDU88_002100 [Pleurodeles waltl]